MLVVLVALLGSACGGHERCRYVGARYFPARVEQMPMVVGEAIILMPYEVPAETVAVWLTPDGREHVHWTSR